MYKHVWVDVRLDLESLAGEAVSESSVMVYAEHHMSIKVSQR